MGLNRIEHSYSRHKGGYSQGMTSVSMNQNRYFSINKEFTVSRFHEIVKYIAKKYSLFIGWCSDVARMRRKPKMCSPGDALHSLGEITNSVGEIFYDIITT